MKFLTQLWVALSPPKPFAAETESAFLRDYNAKFLAQRQVALILALCASLLYLGFDVVDALNNDSFTDIAIYPILPLRLACIIFIALSAWYLFQSAAQKNENHAVICAYFCVLPSYIMLLTLTYLQPFNTNYTFYLDGMLLVLFFLFGFTKLLAKPTLVLVAVLLALSTLTFNSSKFTNRFNIARSNCEDHDSPIVIISIFSIIGCFISIEQERSARHNFAREQELKRSREKTEQKTMELLALKEESRRQAQQQSHEKSKFLADAAHDLRNVMQPVGHFLEAAKDALLRNNNSYAQEYLDEAINAALVMRSTFNAMLDISELESGIIKTHYSNFDVRLLVEAVFKQNKVIADQQQVRLYSSSNHNTRATIVYSDRHHLQRVLLNLVSNGIKYADLSKGKQATVAIAIVNSANYVRLDIIDNGIGIAPTEQKNVFKPLYQLNNPERNRGKGNGLGLSIVQAIIHKLPNHSIKLKSKPGMGTRFTLILPKGDVLNVEEPKRITTQNSTLDGIYALLLEHDLLVKKSIIALLKSNGAEYEAVSSLEELKTLLPTLERDPDMMIADYRLPNGSTAVDAISVLNENGLDIPLLIITGETADLSDRLPGIVILRKPVESEHLLTEITLLCRGKNVA